MAQVPGEDLAQGVTGGLADFNPITLLLKLLSQGGGQQPPPAPPPQVPPWAQGGAPTDPGGAQHQPGLRDLMTR